MIRFELGDIFQSEVDALVNTVNCAGVMGRDLGRQFRRKFPRNFREYKQACELGKVVPSRMFITEQNTSTSPRFIVNFPTKRHREDKSMIDDIETGLVDLHDEIAARDITSIAIPPLGCGHGGLHWPDVRRLIEKTLSSANAEIIVYQPMKLSILS